MKTWNVTMKESRLWTQRVEAETEEEAIKKAYDAADWDEIMRSEKEELVSVKEET